MKTKLYIVSTVIFAALGLSLFLSPPAQAAPICGDSDYTQPCPPPPVECHDADPTAIGPCAAINYATVNCTTFKSYEGPVRCASVKACINDRGVTQAACLQEWKTCRDKVRDAQGKMKSVDREGCMNAVVTGTAYTPAAEGDNKTSCAVEGIGWIICPVMRFMAQLVDSAYSMVSKLLSVPAIDTSTNSSMYKAWSIMRNFANVAFVIAFLVIIYSQVTGVGIGNLGIKRMLPKLIIAAICVNICYWICAAAVDISNIAGVSFKGLLEGAGNQLYTAGSGVESGAGGNWDILTVGLLGLGAAGVALYVGLSALLPMLIMAALAIVTVVLVLTLRQALIIILIVISPLAFVAYLLPNTESLFSKWRGLFQTLLLLFPILSIIFGGSALASTIITNSANGDFVLQVIGAGVTILPLFGAPLILKTVNGTLNRFGVNINDPAKGPFDRMKKGAEGYRNNRQQLRDARALNGGPRFGKSLVQRKARRQAVLSQRERNLNNAKAGYIADATLSNEKSAGQKALEWATVGDMGGKTKGEQMLNQMAKGGGDGARSASLAQALTVQANLEAEEVKAATATIKALNLSQQERREIASGGIVTKDGKKLDGGSDVALQRAGMQSVIDGADIKGINELVDQSRSWTGENGTKLRQSLADSLGSSGARPGYLGQGTLDTIRQGTNASSADELIEKAIHDDVYSAEKIATADKDELNVVATVAATSTTLSIPDKQKIVDSAHTALTDPILSRKIGKNLENVTKLRSNSPPTAPLT